MTPRTPPGFRRPGNRRAKLTLGLALASVVAMIGLFVTVIVVSFQLLHENRATNERSSLAPAAISGPEETVFRWARDRCDVDDIPDLPARAFRDARGGVQLVTAHFMNRRFVGRTLDRLQHPCDLTMASARNADPRRFSDREWLAATYTEDGRTIVALVHNEYQGHQHAGQCPSQEYFKCWYNAVTLVVSRDAGATFRHANVPPQHLVAAPPYRYVPDDGPYGLFSPSNIIRKEDDGYYYVMVRAERYGRQKRGSCLLRTRNLENPASWRAWDGSDFTVRFANPYVGDPDPAAHVCEPVSPDEIFNMHESLTYNTYLGKYLLVGVAPGHNPRGRQIYGIHYSVSDDLQNWTQRKLVREVEAPGTFECGDLNPILYPSIIDPESDSRNFETSGRRPFMYFTRFHYVNCQQGPNRDLVRVRVQFNK